VPGESALGKRSNNLARHSIEPTGLLAIAVLAFGCAEHPAGQDVDVWPDYGLEPRILVCFGPGTGNGHRCHNADPIPLWFWLDSQSVDAEEEIEFMAELWPTPVSMDGNAVVRDGLASIEEVAVAFSRESMVNPRAVAPFRLRVCRPGRWVGDLLEMDIVALRDDGEEFARERYRFVLGCLDSYEGCADRCARPDPGD
jgi:hypothetical protein